MSPTLIVLAVFLVLILRMNAVDVGTTTTLVLAPDPFAAEIMSLSHGGMARPIIPTGHLATPQPGAGQFGGITKMQGKLADPGELSAEVHHDPDLLPPVNKGAQTATMTFPIPDGMAAGAKYVGSALCSGFQIGIPFEDKMTGTLTLAWSGIITHTPSA